MAISDRISNYDLCTPEEQAGIDFMPIAADDPTVACAGATDFSTRFSDRSWPRQSWTLDRQRMFIEALSEGYTVDQACRIVRLSVQSAYALRKRPAGAKFALAWEAALLHGRDRFADTLSARAIDGQTVTITRAGGEVVTRHYFDNRLAMSMLTRYDKYADGLDLRGRHRDVHTVMQNFYGFLDLLETDADAEATADFLSANAVPTGDCGPAAPIADGKDRPVSAPVSADTDADADADADGMSQLPQPNPTDDDSPAAPRARVWLDEFDDWRTDFPPPEDFDGDEDGYYGDKDYSRSLTDAEFGVADAQRAAELAQRAEEDSRARDEHFGLAGDAADDADKADSGSADDNASDARPVAASASSGSSGKGDDRDGDDPVDEDQDDDMVPDEHNDPEMDALRDAFLAIGGGVGADRWVDGQPPAGGDYGAALDAMARFRNFRRQRRP